MKVLVGVIVYDRINNIVRWLNAWHQSEKYQNARIAIVHNQDYPSRRTTQAQTILEAKPDYYTPRKNQGFDIGALRDTLRSKQYEDWDVLLWAVDDNIPMRKDFVRTFVEPFEKNPALGLVGNYWVKSSFYPNYKVKVPDHFRTSCFAISREAAMKLYFPVRLNSKRDCYLFEWLHETMCLTNQIKRLGYDMMPVCGNWNESWVDTSKYVWDIGCLHMKSNDPRCRRDHWKEWNAQFEEGIVC